MGALYLENKLLRDAFVLERMPFLTLLARQLALVLQNTRTFSELAQSTRNLNAAKLSVETLQRVQSQLAKFVPRSVQERIEANPDAADLLAREEDVSVMFVDIAGYTALTELVGAAKAQAIVERYFASYLDAIDEESGDINEIAGDGLMVLFRNHDRKQHALQAVAAALGIQAATRRLNQQESAGQWILVNVGINSGTGTVGAKKLEGRSRTRWTFTATGSVTNLSARMVQAAQGGALLVSAETASRVSQHYRCLALPPQRFKGFDDDIRVFSIDGSAADRTVSAPPVDVSSQESG